MSLLNNLKRYLYGSPEMSSIDTGDLLATNQQTQGLIGTGGEMGGGLLQQNFNQMNNQKGGLLSNIPEGALLGAALYGQGMQGKDPLAGAFPAVTQAAQLKNLLKPRTELQKNLEAAGYKPGTPEYKAALNAYLNKGKKFTLSDEVLNVYNKLKGKTGDDFDDALDSLSDAERTLYNNKIAGNPDLIDQLIKEKMDDLDTPIKLTTMPDTETLTKNQKYEINGVIYRWNGKEMIASN